MLLCTLQITLISITLKRLCGRTNAPDLFAHSLPAQLPRELFAGLFASGRELFALFAIRFPRTPKPPLFPLANIFRRT